MAKRKIPAVSKRRLTFFGTISLVAILYFIFSSLYNLYVIIDLTNQKKQLDDYYAQLQEEASELKIDIEKLNDPEYRANYAREKFLYSKDGEYILQFIDEVDDTSNKLNTLSLNINKNYLITGLSLVMVLVFLYIIFKGGKKNKKRK